MTNTEKYEMLPGNEISMESNMAIVPRDNSFKLTHSALNEALSNNKDFKLKSLSNIENKDNSESSDVYLKAEIEYLNEIFEIELYTIKASALHLQEYGFANNIDEESLDVARSQDYCLGTSMYFGEDNLTSFHLQLKIMHAIVPNASLAIDFMSYRLLSPYWLVMTAKSAIAPSPDYLYTLHCVYAENEEGKRQHWFHTHGLLRCGSVELEMLNILDGYEQMNVLINMTVKKFLTNPTKEKERFTIGYDGMGINLCWLRWEEALNDLPKTVLGGASDREGEENVHNDPGGVLFAVEDGNMMSPEIYASTLAINPIYYITSEETNRMSDLSKERFRLFRDAFDKEHINSGKKNFLKKLFKKEKEPEWGFLVKLGLTVDQSETGDEREHLWFNVIAINGNQIEGKLLNQPYWIAGLNEGNVGKYPIDLLTDWVIYTPDTSYTPDTIYELSVNQEA